MPGETSHFHLIGKMNLPRYRTSLVSRQAWRRETNSMIQFNLLPDVKIEYVKAQRSKRLVMVSAFIATAASFALFLLLLIVVQGVQKKALNDLSGDIKDYSAELRATPDLDKILTIQSQLGSLGSLHEQKNAASRMFGTIQSVTPSDVTISDHAVDFTEHTMTITGNAPTLDKVNTFLDALKFTTFSKEGEESEKAFSNVVLTQFGRDEQGSTYTVTLNYNEALFDNQQEVTLSVPKTITTRSVIGQPTDIFKGSTKTNE
jgi:hypothetical protein